ncbi:MAG: hypothetical protein IJS65_07860 [Clostridia bacterium]|nr:hypothetical protein [Clostridia bacterium]
MEYVNILKSPFVLEGLAVKEEGRLWRLPEELIDNVNENVARNGRYPAGACVRFRTDSPKISLRIRIPRSTGFSISAVVLSRGADVLFDGKLAGMVFSPYGEVEQEGEVSRPWYLPEGVHGVQINLPVSGELEKLEIGVPDGAALLPPEPHKTEKPVVFYGSSITQGYLASRPGCTYVSQLARRLDFELINLGFGSGAHGERIMADYINTFDMSAFVMDYDANDDVPALLERHEPFFKRIREKHPYLPIILPSRPCFERKAINAENRAAVRATYDNAIAAGDKNVYFIDGETFFGKVDRAAFTLDLVHPNDLGMRAMADGMFPILSSILYNK